MIVRERPRIPRTHSKTGTDRKEWRFQQRTSRRIGRVSTSRINRWRWSPFRHVVDPRWLHLSSSQWTSISTVRAEGRTFAIPLTYIDVTGSTHTELDVLQENVLNRNLSDSWRGFTKFIQQKENTKKDTCGPGWDWQRFKRQPDQIMRVQKYGRKLVMPLRIEISRNGQKRNQKLDNGSWWRRIQRNSRKCDEKTWKTCGTSHAF